MIAACLQPGVSLAAVALANGLNANLLRTWVKAYRMQQLAAAVVPAIKNGRGRVSATRSAPTLATLRLYLLPQFLQDLNRRFVGMNEVGLKQMVAQQVDDGLHRFADSDDARHQGVVRQITAKAPQECCLPIERQRVHILVYTFVGRLSRR